MMGRDLLVSPLRLAALTVLGGVLSIVGFVGPYKLHDSPAGILASFASVLVGLISLYWSSYTLREGIQNERWPAAEVDPLRRIVNHPAWTLFLSIFLLAMLSTFVWERSPRSFLWAMFLLVQAMSQLKSSFRPPVTRSSPSARIDWTQVPPLHSEHWGER